MNIRNYSLKTNYICGSNTLDLLPFYVTNINIPGLNFSLPEIGGRSGIKLNMSSDSVTFNGLSMEILMDEDYKVYNEIMNIVFSHINVETGTYADFSFHFWCEVKDDMGKNIMKIDYYDCRIETVGDLTLDSTDETTEQTFNMDLKYDYFKISYL
jgi:hypothetical protein